MQDTKSVKRGASQGEVRPYESVTVYASGSRFLKEGQAIEVHPVLAEKLEKAGKVTLKAQAEKKGAKENA